MFANQTFTDTHLVGGYCGDQFSKTEFPHTKFQVGILESENSNPLQTFGSILLNCNFDFTFFFFNLKAVAARHGKTQWFLIECKKRRLPKHESLSVSVRFSRLSASNLFTSCADSQAAFFSFTQRLFSFLSFPVHILVLNVDRQQRSPRATKMRRCFRDQESFILTCYNWLYNLWRALRIQFENTFFLNNSSAFQYYTEAFFWQSQLKLQLKNSKNIALRRSTVSLRLKKQLFSKSNIHQRIYLLERSSLIGMEEKLTVFRAGTKDGPSFSFSGDHSARGMIMVRAVIIRM